MQQAARGARPPPCSMWGGGRSQLGPLCTSCTEIGSCCSRAAPGLGASLLPLPVLLLRAASAATTSLLRWGLVCLLACGALHPIARAVAAQGMAAGGRESRGGWVVPTKRGLQAGGAILAICWLFQGALHAAERACGRPPAWLPDAAPKSSRCPCPAFHRSTEHRPCPVVDRQRLQAALPASLQVCRPEEGVPRLVPVLFERRDSR